MPSYFLQEKSAKHHPHDLMCRPRPQTLSKDEEPANRLANSWAISRVLNQKLTFGWWQNEDRDGYWIKTTRYDAMWCDWTSNLDRIYCSQIGFGLARTAGTLFSASELSLEVPERPCCSPALGEVPLALSTIWRGLDSPHPTYPAAKLLDLMARIIGERISLSTSGIWTHVSVTSRPCQITWSCKTWHIFCSCGHKARAYFSYHKVHS